MSARIGGLCFGYGGLDLAVQQVIPDADLAWYAEFDKGASKIGAHRFPGVPNHGDMTKIDWSAVEPVDILTGGTPCQDLSHAGKRAGMTEGTRSNLWVAMRDAIATIKPSLVVWENVGGAYSAEATSELESCPGCVGDGPGVHLRALGRVLGDLASLGFDAEWRGLRAADVGAPHGRLRVFVVAWPTADAGALGRLRGAGVVGDGRHAALGGEAGSHAGDSGGAPTRHLPTPTTRDWKGANQRGDTSCLTGALLPTPRAGDGEKGGPNQRGSSGDYMLPSAVTHLLPTPAVNDMGAAYTPDEWDAWCATQQAKHGNGNGHGKSLHVEAQRLLPTPVATDAAGSGNRPTDKASHPGTTLTDATVRESDRWGEYADAIHRWEHLTRPAPDPTETGPKGSPRLSARFSEWMMGLPDGWVTDVPGITRNEALKALGNGVVPQQAAAAIGACLGSATDGVAA